MNTNTLREIVESEVKTSPSLKAVGEGDGAVDSITSEVQGVLSDKSRAVSGDTEISGDEETKVRRVIREVISAHVDDALRSPEISGLLNQDAVRSAKRRRRGTTGEDSYSQAA